jgi:hypothetical protein
MKPIYELTPISDHAKELLTKIDAAKELAEKSDVYALPDSRYTKHKPFGELYNEKRKNEPLYTEGQIKGLEAMYGHNRAKLTEVDMRKEPSTKSYRNVSLWIAVDKLERFIDVTFEDCIIEFCNQDFTGKMQEQGCKFINCTIVYYLHATKVEYKLDRR